MSPSHSLSLHLQRSWVPSLSLPDIEQAGVWWPWGRSTGECLGSQLEEGTGILHSYHVVTMSCVPSACQGPSQVLWSHTPRREETGSHCPSSKGGAQDPEM